MAEELADPNARMALDSSSKNTPPGWKSGIRTYPLGRYRQIMTLWKITTEINQIQFGAAIIQRLEGSAFQFAMRLVMTVAGTDIKCPDFLGHAGGTAYLCNRLKQQYSAGGSQEAQMAMLESFFELRQSKSSIEDHVQTFKIVYADAADQSTLQISNVGKPYFFLKSSDLSERQKFDILVRVDGNMQEFTKILILTVQMHGTNVEASNAAKQNCQLSSMLNQRRLR
jgi:hypothetical protein